MATGHKNPWSLAFLPDGGMIVTTSTAEGTPNTLELRCSAFSEIVDGDG